LLSEGTPLLGKLKFLYLLMFVLGVKWQQIINSKRSAEGKEQ
jgi:hypothetical protein